MKSFVAAVRGSGLALICALGAVSCGDSSDGSAGSGGAAGSSGEGGSGGTNGGVGGTAGASGQGGNGGQAGSSGQGGSGGSSVDGGAGSGGMGGSSGSGGDGGAPPACDASEAPALGRMGLEPVVQGGGLSGVVNAAQPPGSDDWYLVELTGRVMVYADGALRETPFLDLQDQISLSGGYDERGLLSLTFAPDYETSGKFYVTIIPTTGEDQNHDMVLEYTRSASDPYVADTSTRRAIMDLEPGGQAPGWNNFHNASTARFGPDGMLYVGVGDGGGECNSARPGFPQQTDNPYGKILRLDPSKSAPHAADGNPFTGGEDDPRVLHYGFRNPFRFAFDSITGDLYIGDVGQWDFEEVSVAPYGTMGLNFGWPDFEAMASDTCPSAPSLADGETHTPPIHTIEHGGSGGPGSLTISIVGGTVYRGDAIPELYGAYLFGEYYPNRPMGALYHCDGETSDVTSIRKVCDPNNPDDACFIAQGGAPSLAEVGAIIEGNDGELYLAANGSALLKVVPAE